jgi:hypothetical protein
VFLSPQQYSFSVKCGIDINGKEVDIMAVVSYSLNDCLMACASYNRNTGSTICKGVEFNADLTTVVPNYFGTCWLKKFTTAQIRDTNSTNFNLHVGAILLEN